MQIRTLLPALAAAILLQAQAYSATTLQPSSNGRYIQWSDGTPVFQLSDTAWTLPGLYTDSEVTQYLTTRASQGFVSIQMSACFPSPGFQNINSIFTNGDFARPVTSYWTHVDWVVNQATSRGLIVIINPFWKHPNEAIISSNGTTKCRAYGKWFATRYRNNTRVQYFLGGDDKPDDVRAQLDAMGLGIDDAYAEAGLPKPLVAYHGDPRQTSREAYPTATWVTLDWIYEYSPTLSDGSPYMETWQDWVKTPAKPMMFGEGFYDRNNGGTASSRWGDRHMLRRQAWWSTIGGAIGGYAYGAEPIWIHYYNGISPQTATGWNSGQDAVRLKNFLGGIEWTRLQPDINHAFLTGGYGTFAGLDYAIGAVADNKSYAVVYSPTAHSLNLKMPTVSGATYTLRWFDPSSGAFRSGSTTTASGASITMATPGNNASGKPDWVLLATTGTVPPVTGQPANGTYKIVNRKSGKCLDTVGSSTADGTFIEQWTYLGGNDQKWNVTSVGNGQYSIIGVASGKAMDIQGASTANGARAEIATYTGASNQKWTFTDLSGFYSILAVHSSKALDVSGGSLLDGGVVLQYTNGGSTNQQWSLGAP